MEASGFTCGNLKEFSTLSHTESKSTSLNNNGQCVEFIDLFEETERHLINSFINVCSSLLLSALPFFFFFFKRFYVFIFRERGGRETEGEKHLWLPLVDPQVGTWPTAQTYTVTRSQTSNLMICKLTLSPLSHTSQSNSILFLLLLIPRAVFLAFNFDSQALEALWAMKAKYLSNKIEKHFLRI